MVELHRSGRTIAELSREFEPSSVTISKWVKQADLDDGLRPDGLTTAEREEMRQLERENRQLKIKRDILKKAEAWFARETGTAGVVASMGSPWSDYFQTDALPTGKVLSSHLGGST